MTITGRSALASGLAALKIASILFNTSSQTASTLHSVQPAQALSSFSVPSSAPSSVSAVNAVNAPATSAMESNSDSDAQI
ncbi:MAG: hypothetical protein CVV64_20495 [Candidatus Wallbacteria bacterium HGW-Wallbacteria-1]|uniref:Uncharacterized protein n=1 Tax=Candidatus Wallbacteria bacterium HGW-Wallbacteria-1 TaxID=2013854 RepID=A0A2N1PI99_9BACT|nr:MAG: hypothetical protein CVV64_20495 [Candidatus Wallbacteria bacterium HGW-Wallbacteria-1]